MGCGGEKIFVCGTSRELVKEVLGRDGCGWGLNQLGSWFGRQAEALPWYGVFIGECLVTGCMLPTTTGTPSNLCGKGLLNHVLVLGDTNREFCSELIKG